MIIDLLETEPNEEAFFNEHLAAHTLRYPSDPAEVGADSEILSTFIYTKVDAAFLDAHPKLRLVSTRSTGVDHIDLAACRERGVTVSMVPSYGDNTVAEHAFGLILALSRRLRDSMQASQADAFSYESIRGFDLHGKTIGIVGSGRIGLHAIRIAKAFNMRVLAYDLRPQYFMGEILGFEYLPLSQLLPQCDLVSLHLPLIPDTFHLLNRATFAQCKRGVIIINTARGGLIDTEALIEALDSGQVGGAGLDVLEDERVLQRETMHIISDQIINRLQSGAPPGELRASDPERIGELRRLMRNAELIGRSNVVFTPHVAFNSVEAVARINQTTKENILSFIAGEPLNDP